MPNGAKWYQLSVEQTFEELEADDTGLTSSEAKARLEKYGYNELKFKKPSSLMRLLRQFQNSLVYILLIATLLTAILGMWMDNFGFECSESFRVTEDGCETFANFPRKLFVIN